MIIAGLVGEAIIIVFVATGTKEKALSVIFTLLIALGVWLEEIGGGAIEAREKAENALRLAELAARAEEARLETERLRSQFGWRMLSDEEGATLIAGLSKFSGQVRISCASGDVESSVYAMQFARAFQLAGWKAGLMAGATATPFLGIRVPLASDAAAESFGALQAALTTAGIEFENGPEPTFGMAVGSSPDLQNPAYLYIGPKMVPWAKAGPEFIKTKK